MAMPLEGVRIIDWTIFQQGPVATAMLGDLGAEVIKIEERERGDPGRGMAGTMGYSTLLPGGRNHYFETNNRNKKGITLDLRNPKAVEVVYRLVEKSDVFVQNFRKGVAERLGLDYESLRKHNPKLIYAQASGYGPDGPESARPSLDPVGLARAGFMLGMTGPGEVPPYPMGGIADQMGAVMLAFGVLAALAARELQGVGQKVDSSHLSSVMWLEGLAVNYFLMTRKNMPKWQRTKTGNPMNTLYKTKDGRWIFFALMMPERYWPSFCTSINRPELQRDPRFDSMNKRKDNRESLISLLDEVFASKTCDEWLAIFKDYEDFIFEPLQTIPDLENDPQVQANKYIVEFDHPDMGKTKYVNFPVILHETPASIRLPAPAFGQHTEEVLTEICGYSWEEVAKMRDEKIV